MAGNRVFYQTLQKVGGNGKYQIISLIICSLIMMVCGATTFFNAFLFYQDPYTCMNLPQPNCKLYVCSLHPQQRTFYLNKNIETFASKFGDFRCQGQYELNFAQSFIYGGGIFGVIFGILLSNLLTKRKLLIIAIIGNLVGMIITITAPNLLIASIGLFINFAAKSIQNQIIPCFISQTVDDQVKGRHIMVVYIFFAIGVSLNGLFFKYISKWEMVLILYIMVPSMIALVLFLKYMQQTPIDLIVNSSPEQSLKALNRIAFINNRENQHHLTILQLQNIKRQYEQNQAQKHDYSISFLDLFRYSSLRLITFLVIILHFLISFQFHAPQLALKDYEINIYLNGIIIGASQLASAVACYFIIDRYQRKFLIYITQFVSLIIATNLYLFFSCKQKNCSTTIEVIQTGGLFAYRFLTTIAYNIFYMIQFEVFPTQIRSLGIQSSAISANIALVVIPSIITVCERAGVSIMLFYAICCVLVGIFTIKIPQTFGVPSPEMIEQLDYQHLEIQEKYP